MAEQGNKVANIVSRVETDYKERIVPELMKRFNYSSVMEVPHLEKNRHQHGCWSSCSR